MRRVTVAIVSGALAVSVALTACTGGDSSTTASTPPPTTQPSTVAQSEFCVTFAGLSQQRDGGGGGARNQDEADWDRNIATVEHIDAVAPEEIKPQADAYVQMVKDRKELAAANNWADVSELSSDARSAFISTHADLQQQVNELIAFSKANCDGVN
jgi:hypothetical protein